ncbi:PSD1 and planctomycete cytochrome C domain-containing protein [Rubripirellula amarantea]|nr:PSD1 and planctomycete cytochrome C domain-containing protein [Rubripirellula amarantea]
MRSSFFQFMLIFAWGLLVTTAKPACGEGTVDFNSEIRPILSKHCIACHGPDEADRQAGLRLDHFEGATEDLGGYSAIDVEDPEASEMIIRIETDDADLKMPPPEHAAAVTDNELALLKTWIAQGAVYQTHWSFSPPTRHATPMVSQGRVHNFIDAFILEKAQARSLNQNPIAEPPSLVRRVCLDLTGFPPIAHSDLVQRCCQDFLNDPTQDHLSSLVDQLLQSNAYAEHWASMWLDLARYADTVGYSGDEQRDIWPWRDWLIRAIGDNKSYRDLSIEMIAGDMLPDATDEQRLATAFNRNTLSNNEGGTNDEEFRTIAIKDRLSTTINAWMGLTVRCAECHSHKYDPISQTEYYSLLDFFNQSADADRTDERPKLEVIPAPDPKVTARLNDQIAKLEKKLEGTNSVWNEIRPIEMTSREGTKFEQLSDNSILAVGPNPAKEEYKFTFEAPAGSSIQAIRLEAIPHLRYDNRVGRSGEGAFILSQIRLTQHDGEKETRIAFADAENDFNQVNQHARTAIAETVESGGKQGWAVNHPVDGYKAHREAIFQLAEPLIATTDTKFTVYLLHDPPWARLNLGCVRISTCNVENAAKKYRDKELDPVRREIHRLITERDAPVRVPVMEQLPNDRRRETFVMLRGNFQSPGEKVTAEFPKAFAPTDETISNDRLGLARWLFEESNPLTARVAANRYWARMMGIGIVETEEDFGTQGSPPSHPQLLDALAIELQDNNWDVQHLLKLIVMSATYQQSATVDENSLTIDPRNRLLSRGPRVRLSAEVVRDQALAVSGLLSNKMYGPPVYPPSPIKRVVNAFTGGFTWQESVDEDRYRRALYTYLKRSAPHPLFETFDMSSRDICSMRRLRTNTPLQSFMTLNDVTFIEAARALADKMLESSQSKKFSDPDTQLASEITQGLRAALYVEPDPNQIQVLSKLYRSSFERFQTDLDSAIEFAGNQEASKDTNLVKDNAAIIRKASMTLVANVILNLDGFLNN